MFGEPRDFGFLGSCYYCKWKLQNKQMTKHFGSYNRVAKYPNGLNAPHVRNTATQLIVNADCFHIEFGIIAGLPRCSCRRIQRANVGIKATAIERVAIFAGTWMLDELPVITLPKKMSLSELQAGVR
jgi:hypothetical protein